LLGPLILVLLICAGLFFGAQWLRPGWFQHNPALDPNASARPIAPRGDLAEDEKTTIEIYNKVKPSVVHITTLANVENRFTLDVQQVPQGTGSGFIWDKQGHVVTNFHVIQGAAAARVTLADQRSYSARVVGAAPQHDLAVLVIDAPSDKLQPIQVGESDNLQVGQNVFAIGNPFGLDQSLTKGIVSALGREIESVAGTPMKGLIQTDAAINPGNSGGPLLDSAGRLIGVNVAIRQGAQGIGFAIPVDDVNRVVPELIRNGKVTRPGLGIQIVPDQTTKQLNLSVEGVVILHVLPDSPAAKAGLKGTQRDPGTGKIVLGDIITALDGRPIKATSDLYDALKKRKVGDSVTVTVEREGEKVDVPVTLSEIG
jgi:S1-C subfamily serine protease